MKIVAAAAVVDVVAVADSMFSLTLLKYVVSSSHHYSYFDLWMEQM